MKFGNALIKSILSLKKGFILLHTTFRVFIEFEFPRERKVMVMTTRGAPNESNIKKLPTVRPIGKQTMRRIQWFVLERTLI